MEKSHVCCKKTLSKRYFKKTYTFNDAVTVTIIKQLQNLFAKISKIYKKDLSDN